MAPVVPIIDMSNFEARRGEVMQQLMDAAEKIGFFQVNVCVRGNTLWQGLPLTWRFSSSLSSARQYTSMRGTAALVDYSVHA